MDNVPFVLWEVLDEGFCQVRIYRTGRIEVFMPDLCFSKDGFSECIDLCPGHVEDLIDLLKKSLKEYRRLDKHHSFDPPDEYGDAFKPWEQDEVLSHR